MPPTPPQQLPETTRTRRTRNTRSESAEPAPSDSAPRTSTKLTREAKVSKKRITDAPKGRPSRKAKASRPTVTASQDDPTSTQSSAHSETSSQNDVAYEPEASQDAQERIHTIEETPEDEDITPNESEIAQIPRSPLQAHPVQVPQGVPHAQETGESSPRGIDDDLDEESSRMEVESGSSPLSSPPSHIVTPEATPGLGRPDFSSTPPVQSSPASPSTRSESETSLLFRSIVEGTPRRPSAITRPYQSPFVMSDDDPTPPPPARTREEYSPYSPLLTEAEYGYAQRSVAQRSGLSSTGSTPRHPPSLQYTPARPSNVSESGDTPMQPPSVEYAPAQVGALPSSGDTPTRPQSLFPSSIAAEQAQHQREAQPLRENGIDQPLPTQSLQFSLGPIINVEVPASVAHDLLKLLERHPEMQWSQAECQEQITKALIKTRRHGLTDWQMAGDTDYLDSYLKKNTVFIRDPEPHVDDPEDLRERELNRQAELRKTAAPPRPSHTTAESSHPATQSSARSKPSNNSENPSRTTSHLAPQETSKQSKVQTRAQVVVPAPQRNDNQAGTQGRSQAAVPAPQRNSNQAGKQSRSQAAVPVPQENGNQVESQGHSQALVVVPQENGHQVESQGNSQSLVLPQENGNQAKSKGRSEALAQWRRSTRRRRAGRDEQVEPNYQQGRERHMSRVARTRRGVRRAPERSPVGPHGGEMLKKFCELQTKKNREKDEEREVNGTNPS